MTLFLRIDTGDRGRRVADALKGCVQRLVQLRVGEDVGILVGLVGFKGRLVDLPCSFNILLRNTLNDPFADARRMSSLKVKLNSFGVLKVGKTTTVRLRTRTRRGANGHTTLNAPGLVGSPKSKTVSVSLSFS